MIARLRQPAQSCYTCGMNDVGAALWITVIVTVLVALSGVVAWALARHRRHHTHRLTATLVDQHLGLAAAGESARQVAYLNLHLTNNSSQPLVVDGLGYRSAGSRRPVPIRNLNAPGPGSMGMAGDTLLPPPYRLAPGASQTITIYAPALCTPDDLAGIYFHIDDGELVWLPTEQVQSLTRSCIWASEVAPSARP